MTDIQLDSEWKEQKQPPSLTRSFEFNSYAEMRHFLDELANLSEQSGYYPNLNFTRTRVNLSIEGEGEQLAERDYTFADKTMSLATGVSA